MVKLTTNTGVNFYVSAEDLPKLEGMKFTVHNEGYITYRKHWKDTPQYLHRLLAGAGEGDIVDHVNGNKVDNTRGNLRITDRTGNNRNRHGANKNSKTGVKGVTNWKGERYRASITYNHKHIHLGIFNTLDEAIIARKEAEKKYFGLDELEAI